MREACSDKAGNMETQSNTFCADFLRGRCKNGAKCTKLHVQWETMVKGQFCPLYVVGQCKHRCKYGWEHTLVFED